MMANVVHTVDPYAQSFTSVLRSECESFGIAIAGFAFSHGNETEVSQRMTDLATLQIRVIMVVVTSRVDLELVLTAAAPNAVRVAAARPFSLLRRRLHRRPCSCRPLRRRRRC